MNVEWMIDLDSLDDQDPPIEYTIFPNNSLLMLRSVAGSYQCGYRIGNTHQFDVTLASNYIIMCNSILMFMNCYL